MELINESGFFQNIKEKVNLISLSDDNHSFVSAFLESTRQNDYIIKINVDLVY
jgi:hypothetical protein